MSEIVWLSGFDDVTAEVGNTSVVWHVRLDVPEAEKMAGAAKLSPDDFKELAAKPEAGMRGMRRRLAKVLLARLSGLHPDQIVIAKMESGAPHIVHPAGWHISVAGRWPHCLIGVGHTPIGVDIEPLDTEPPPEDSFTATETRELQGASNETLILRWTAKEAHAKCFGVASSIDAAEMETTLSGDRLNVVSCHGTTKVLTRLEAGTAQTAAFLQDR